MMRTVSIQLSLTPEEEERLSVACELYAWQSSLGYRMQVNLGCGIVWICILKPTICYECDTKLKSQFCHDAIFSVCEAYKIIEKKKWTDFLRKTDSPWINFKT
jgi:hypothetical protein